MKHASRVALLGGVGSHSEDAVSALLGENAELIARADFPSVFRAVTEGAADCAVVPVENSRAGVVGEVLDLWGESGIRGQAEWVLPVHHALLAPRGAVLAGITEVHSHAQALAQCAKFLSKQRVRLVPASSTIAAAREIHARGDVHVAAVARKEAAVLLGLSVLAENIETDADNRTRFVLLGATPSKLPQGPLRTTLRLELEPVPGALHRALGVFAERRLDLARVECRPSGEGAWRYVFFIDIWGDVHTPQGEALVTLLSDQCRNVRWLGSYPVGGAGALPAA
ncbi:MAG: prephenate dehydratase [Myxococcaceae bacterium]